MSLDMTQKPYIVRALWDWCNDQGNTPHILVQADSRARVPMAYVAEGKIVLDISMEATSGLDLAGDAIQFQARFGGVAHTIYVPYINIVAIFAAENGQGMSFEVPEIEEEAQAYSEISEQVEEPKVEVKPKASPLKLVK